MRSNNGVGAGELMPILVEVFLALISDRFVDIQNIYVMMPLRLRKWLGEDIDGDAGKDRSGGAGGRSNSPAA